jgi:hypothetical protein
MAGTARAVLSWTAVALRNQIELRASSAKAG